VSTIEELIGRKNSGSGLEKNENTAVGIRCADQATSLYPQRLALTSPTSGGRSIGIACSRTKGHGVIIVNRVSFSLNDNLFFRSEMLLYPSTVSSSTISVITLINKISLSILKIGETAELSFFYQSYVGFGSSSRPNTNNNNNNSI
jgi:hypothetical protein